MKIESFRGTIIDPLEYEDKYRGKADYECIRMGTYAFIEAVGRTCYQSEDKITDTSCIDFVKKLVERRHWAMFEHAYIYIAVDEDMDALLRFLCKDTLTDTETIGENSTFSFGYSHPAKFINYSEELGLMSINMSAMMRLLNWPTDITCKRGYNFYQIMNTFYSLMYELNEIFPEVFNRNTMKFYDMAVYFNHLTEYDEDYDFRKRLILSVKDFRYKIERSRDVPQWRRKLPKLLVPHTVKFIADRGVTHELVRHRLASFAQESTRYCNYSKGKYGNSVTFTRPSWAEREFAANDPMADKYKIWADSCAEAEKNYLRMIEAGASPQEARAVLPNSTKSVIIITAIEYEWEHILNLRLRGTTGAPHPDMSYMMRTVANDLYKASNNRLGIYEEPAMCCDCSEDDCSDKE